MVTDTVFIYALNCPITGQTRYIGKSKDPHHRFRSHIRDRSRNHRTNWIQSLVVIGQNPVLEILDEVPTEFWPQWEVAWIAHYRETGFDLVNNSVGGEGSDNPTPETRAKMGAALKGKKNPSFGKHHSAKHCAKIRAANVGQKRSSETCANISAAQLGRKDSDETRAKKSAARIGEKNPSFGKHPSEETRAKIRASLTGKKHSAEARANMSAARLGKKRGPYKKKKLCQPKI